MIEEIPTPIALLFAGYIVGAGYLAFLSLYKGKFVTVPYFDKFIISLIFGSLAFSSIILVFNIQVDFNNIQSLSNLLKVFPLIFLFNILVARILMQIWDFLDQNILKEL